MPSMPPSSRSATCTGADQWTPPSCEVTVMIWSSNSFGVSHAAEFCWFMKPTTTSPFGSTAGYEKKLSSHAPAGPAGPWFAVQKAGFDPEISVGLDQVLPASSEYERTTGDRRKTPLLNSSWSQLR